MLITASQLVTTETIVIIQIACFSVLSAIKSYSLTAGKLFCECCHLLICETSASTAARQIVSKKVSYDILENKLDIFHDFIFAFSQDLLTVSVLDHNYGSYMCL